jgi:hypothetical protein
VPHRSHASSTVSAILAGALCIAPHAAGAAIGERLIADQVRVEYVTPKDAAHLRLHEVLTRARALEYVRELLSPLRLPQRLRMVLTECNGESNAWYENGADTICYELVHESVKNARAEPLPAGRETRDAIVGPLLDTVLHEAAHAVFELLKVPLFGREEDAADQFSAYLMLQYDKARARRLILGAAYQYRMDVREAEVALSIKAFADEHGLPAQRFFNVLCVAYGADPKLFAVAVERGYLPRERAEDCGGEYEQVRHAFQKLIGPYLDRRLVRKLKRKLTQAGEASR